MPIGFTSEETTMIRIRSRKILPTRLESGWLLQWTFVDRSPNCRLFSFRSVVTRPGKSGFWLDVPYFAYAGEHKYRRLPRRIERHLIACCVRGYAHHAMAVARKALGDAWMSARIAVARSLKYAPGNIIRRRRAEREMAEYFSDL